MIIGMETGEYAMGDIDISQAGNNSAQSLNNTSYLQSQRFLILDVAKVIYFMIF